MPLTPDTASKILGSIRLVNGLAALALPQRMARQFGVDPDANPAAVYVLRLFGVRTVLLGLLLLLPADPEERRAALRRGVLIHASDTTAAFIAAVKKQLPARAAVTGMLISATNTGLALAALRGTGRAPAGIDISS